MTTDALVALLAVCHAAAQDPALSHGGRTLTYARFESRIALGAAALKRMGFLPGDRVLFSVGPTLDGVCLAFAIIAAGGTVVVADPDRDSDPDAGAALVHARAELVSPRWVAADARLYAESSRALRGLARRRADSLPRYAALAPGARHLYLGRWRLGVPRTATGVASLFEPVGLRQSVEPIVDASHEALIVFTEGMTDAPRAVVHSRASLGAGLVGIAESKMFRPRGRVVTDRLTVGISALLAGAQWCIPGEKTVQCLASLVRTDVLAVDPLALERMLRLLDSAPERSPQLATLLLCGGRLSRALLARARARWPTAVILVTYGTLEMLGVAIADGDEKLAYAGTGDFVGEPLCGVVTRIERGALVLSGPALALGYLDELPGRPLNELSTGISATFEANRLVLRPGTEGR